MFTLCDAPHLCRREKNRLAARKCRAKKIACMAVTQQRVAELTEANKELQVGCMSATYSTFLFTNLCLEPAACLLIKPLCKAQP